MKAFRKKYHPPGTLAKRSTVKQLPKLSIDMVNFSPAKIEYYNDITLEQCQQHYNDSMTTWIHVRVSVDFNTLKLFGDLFRLHPLAMEDVLNYGQRPKAEIYENQLFVIVNLPIFGNDEIHIEQVSLFCGKGYLLSFHDQLKEDVYSILHKRLQKNTHDIRNKDSDHLLYVLIDLVTDSSFPILEMLGSKLENIESSLSSNSNRVILKEIHNIKRELILLRRALWPQREVINNLQKDEDEFFRRENKLYLRDGYDHTIQILELIDSYRDLATSTLDIYLSLNSYWLNEAMRFLTIISTIFIPSTFIVGVYGMNFQLTAGPLSMPELSWPLGYLAVWLLMIGIAMGLLVFFKRKGWL